MVYFIVRDRVLTLCWCAIFCSDTERFLTGKQKPTVCINAGYNAHYLPHGLAHGKYFVAISGSISRSSILQ